MLPLTGKGVGGEKRDGKSHILKQSKPFQCACGVVPSYLDALFAGPGQNTAVEPRCQNRPEARQHSFNSSIREAKTEGPLGLSVQPNLLGEFWAIKRACLKKAGLGGDSVDKVLVTKA